MKCKNVIPIHAAAKRINKFTFFLINSSLEEAERITYFMRQKKHFQQARQKV